MSTTDLNDLAQGWRTDEIKGRVVRETVVSLERFICALCRLFTLADLGPDAMSLSVTVAKFWRLDDEALGNTVYDA